MPNWNDGPKLNLNGLTEFKQKLDELFAKKADNNGHYSDLTSGNAEQLISTAGIEDRVPYNFRRSGGSADIGDREIDKIVGGTIAWNQKVRNPDFTRGEAGLSYWESIKGTSVVTNGVCKYTYTEIGPSVYSSRLSQTYQGFADWEEGKVYFMGFTHRESKAESSIRFGMVASTEAQVDATSSTSWARSEKVFKLSSSLAGNGKWLSVYYKQTATVGDWFEVKDLVLIDLTQMFGSAVANQIAAMETANAGAGTAYVKSLFPKDLYQFDNGTLMSVNTSAHTMVGFNQWDEEWEEGSWSIETGELVPATGRIINSNHIPVVPNTAYYINVPYTTDKVVDVIYRDASGNFIASKSDRYSRSFTTPSNCWLIDFGTWSTYGGTYHNDICVNISCGKNGTYEPYQKFTYPLDSSLTLRGIPKLDANDELYYDGDTYESDGTVTRRYGVITLDGTQSILASSFTSGGYVQYRITAIGGAEGKNGGGFKSDKYKNFQTGDQNADSYINLYYESYARILIRDSRFGSTITDATGWNAWLASNNVHFLYELATPTTETAEPYQNPQIVDPYGTEEYVDERTVAVPVGHDTLYLENLRAKIEGLPWDMSMLAPIENGATASQAYAQGKYFMRNNKFCKATTAIASGATFTLGTNYEETTIGAELYAALNS